VNVLESERIFLGTLLIRYEYSVKLIHHFVGKGTLIVIRTLIFLGNKYGKQIKREIKENPYGTCVGE
jgi:hypothetical protein